MRKMLILLTLAMLTTASTGCSRCRSLFRRGAPCGGTTLAAPAMLGGAIPLGNPIRLQQAPQIVSPGMMAQPGCCCEQAAPMCCEPCPTNCVPCESGYVGGTGYAGGMGADCGCPTAPGEFFGGYVEGSDPPPPSYGGAVTPQSSGTFPQPTN